MIMENLIIKIPQEKYPIESEYCFIGEITEQNKNSLKLLGYIKEW